MMPNFTVTAPGAYGRRQLELYNYSQVLELNESKYQAKGAPKTLDYPEGVSLELEISQAFDNVATMLGSVGLTSGHVGHINSYHVMEANGQITAAVTEMVRQFGLRCS
jgi:hypothetical protein